MLLYANVFYVDAVAFAIRSMEFHLTTQPAKSAQSILVHATEHARFQYTT